MYDYHVRSPSAHFMLISVCLCLVLPSTLILHLLVTTEELDALHIVRLPRIGRGKHNVHLDPYDSDEHQAVCAVIDACNIPHMLSQHTNKVVRHGL